MYGHGRTGCGAAQAFGHRPNHCDADGVSAVCRKLSKRFRDAHKDKLQQLEHS